MYSALEVVKLGGIKHVAHEKKNRMETETDITDLS